MFSSTASWSLRKVRTPVRLRAVWCGDRDGRAARIRGISPTTIAGAAAQPETGHMDCSPFTLFLFGRDSTGFLSVQSIRQHSKLSDFLA